MAEDQRDARKGNASTPKKSKTGSDDRTVAPTSPRTTAAPTPEIAEGMRNPAGEPGLGKQTADGIAAPHQREATEGRDKVVGGFTSSSLSGSEGGRDVHGTETEDKEDSV